MAVSSKRGFNTQLLHTEIPFLAPHTHVMPPFSTSTYATESLDHLDKGELFGLVVKAMDICAPHCKAVERNAVLTILVTVIKSKCFISAATDFHKYKKYNFQEIISPQIERTKEKNMET